MQTRKQRNSRKSLLRQYKFNKFCSFISRKKFKVSQLTLLKCNINETSMSMLVVNKVYTDAALRKEKFYGIHLFQNYWNYQ